MDGHLVFAQSQLVQDREVRLIRGHDMIQNLGDTPGFGILLLIQLAPCQMTAGGCDLFGDCIYPGIPMLDEIFRFHMRMYGLARYAIGNSLTFCSLCV